MKRTDTNTIHNTPLELHVNAQNPKKNVSQDNYHVTEFNSIEKHRSARRQISPELHCSQPNDDLSK
jgi:hypothetical protein